MPVSPDILRAALGRRGLLLGAGALAGVGAVARAPQAAVATSARIIVIGAGAAGLATASRLAMGLSGASITMLDKRREHHYQPGYTLVAAGLKSPDYVLSSTREWVARGVNWVEEAAAEIDPVGKTVTTDAGQRLPYDFLVVATGLTLDYGAIEGMDVSRIGQNGLGSVYAGPAQAAATWRAMSDFADKGGQGVFLRPATEMKCAGAPLKYAFLTDDYLRRRGNRGRAELTYNAQNRVLFSVPIVAERVRMLYAERNIRVTHDHVLRKIDLDRRIATFRTPQGDAEQAYDFINVIPPMRAPEVVRNSPLPWQTGPWAADGWAEVDRHTLRHVRFPEVFCVGDVAGVPKGKTAASVKWQVPVAVDHLIATIQGRESAERYNGYTSCPLITRVGRAMLVEFDYNDNLVPSFPGVIAPLEELWISWIMKEVGLKPTYLAMLRGRA
ncbi:NAD(P)/FAD-dependent oxidoreductase [Roseococcus thiosulfatophilus]|uniref:NAD(P)/FAD-dependent oxidoreductase n=1 Tax=Roseococcus thiosulfatophilus TaxID=35813 RepID=UPI001A8D1D26|nr:FAD/NAD(P)-binding oxidoreductase [Roseococcus thiosulfatophilus]